MRDCLQTRRPALRRSPWRDGEGSGARGGQGRDPIYKVRDVDVVLDADLARLYGIETKRLNEQVKRNAERFDGGFAFQATKDDTEVLRSQIATSKHRTPLWSIGNGAGRR